MSSVFEAVKAAVPVREAAEKYGAETFPFAVIDGKFYNTQELLNYILEYNK